MIINDLKLCKLCHENRTGPFHVLTEALRETIERKAEAEQRQDYTRARYYAEREDVYRRDLFMWKQYFSIGWHDFKAEDNLDTIERLAIERKLI